ncbi:MAG: acyl-CoA dehydrogenase family protein [Acidimicrobiia bacterium]
MRFAWTDDQLSFRDAARDLLAKECDPAAVRAAWTAPAGALDRGVWAALEAMGVLAVLVPEADGGLGLDERFLVPVVEESGRAALAHPLVETALVGAPLGLTGMVATDLGGPLVPCAADAEVLLVHRDGVLRAHRPDEVVLEPVATVDGARRAARVEPTGAGTLVADDPGVVALAFDRGALGVAAQLVGLCRAMLDLTVAYVVQRQQFGVPIGSFQAVKHHLADALLAVELAAPAVARAADSVARDVPERTRDVSMAKAMATDAADVTGRAALQCHGAIGYTVEHDLHLYLKRSWALARSWGDRSFHADRVADAIGA